jgi:hypothetical protein
MESWAVALENQLLKQNDLYSRCTGTLRSRLGGMLRHVKCGKCDADTWIGALIKFPCERIHNGIEYEVEHTLCFDCLEDKLERHRGFLERERTNPAKRALYDKCLECIICCEECHTPAVISRKVGYEGGIEAEGGDEGGGRRKVRYVLNTALTEKLRDFWGTHSFYENQRRSPFSKFSKDKLLPIERPHISDDKGNKVKGEAQELEPGYVWLEDWRVVANVTVDEYQPKDRQRRMQRALSQNPNSNLASETPSSNSLANNNNASSKSVSSSANVASTSNESTLLSSSAAANVSQAAFGAESSGTDAVTSSSFIGLNRAVTGNSGGGKKKDIIDKSFKDEIEQAVTDASGWQYAFLWPVPDGYVKWKSEPSVHKTFVRRRKKTRTYLKLTEPLLAQLREFNNKEHADQKQ